jgi:hypothetical protein
MLGGYAGAILLLGVDLLRDIRSIAPHLPSQ